MGCTASKLDGLPAVALCRRRCDLIEEALRHSYAFADAHAAYMQSLNSVAVALVRFFDDRQIVDNSVTGTTTKDDLFKESECGNSRDHVQSPASDSDSEGKGKCKEECLDRKNNSSNYKKTLNYSVTDYSNYGGFAESNAPPPPPPAPSSSAWDFLNFFDAYSTYEVPYSGEFDSVEGNGRGSYAESVEKLENVGDENVKFDGEGKNGGDGVVGKSAVLGEERSEKQGSCDELKNESGGRNFSKVMREIQVLFERAAESGNGVSRMLDAGKLNYNSKSSIHQVSSKMLQAFSPSLSMVSSTPATPRSSGSSCSATPKSSELSPFTGNIDSLQTSLDEDLGINFSSLSLTLKKLCMWERKLYDEVKVEEKLCMAYQKKSTQLKHLEKKGSDAHKVESARNLLRTISVKMKIAIQVVDKLSITVNKLREEELWPRISEFIQMLFGMWKAILECHKLQSHAAAETKHLDAILSNGKLTDANFEAAMQLKHELGNWILNFSSWIRSQKDFVKSVNSWLLKCFLYEPDEIQDGAVAFSPDRVSSVLVICNHWSQVVDQLSEKEVTETMQGLFENLGKLLKQHFMDIQRRVIIDKEFEKQLKNMEREEQKFLKAIQARVKDMPLVIGEGDAILATKTRRHSETENARSSLHSSLKLIFEALEKFTTEAVRVYEDVSSKINEEQLGQQNPEG